MPPCPGAVQCLGEGRCGVAAGADLAALQLPPLMAAALREDSGHLAAVRHFIDQQRARRGQSPPIPALPDDPRVRALTVRPHPLTDYQQLAQEAPHERSDRHGYITSLIDCALR
jgi:hypothetical protein